jgi:hypothetical protein
LKNFIGKIFDYLWLRFWWHLVPSRVKNDYKYIGYDIWYLEGMVEVLNDEVDENEYDNTWNSFQKGQLYAYRDMLRSLKDEE